MDPLTWTGTVGAWLNPALTVALVLTLFFGITSIVQSMAADGTQLQPDGTATATSGGFTVSGMIAGTFLSALVAFLALALGLPEQYAALRSGLGLDEGGFGGIALTMLVIGAILAAIQSVLPPVLSDPLLRLSGLATVAIGVLYILSGLFFSPETSGIIGAMAWQFLPVWIALIVLFAVSITFKRKLGLYGKLYDSPIGMIGFGLVMFWVFTGIFGAMDLIITHDPLAQVSGMKNKVPGTPLRSAEEGEYAWYLLGGDNLARDVFSRMVKGAWVVVQIAPLATLFAFMVGITLGLPAGYYGGRLDTFLSFLANLILAFPVILLFYLLVTPEIVATGVPNYMATVLFVFPLVFMAVLLNSRYYTQPSFRTPLLIVVLGIMGLLYLSLISEVGSKVHLLPGWLDLFDIPGGILVVFVSVVFVNSPTVFRIVRGLAMDIKTRDYVAAAQTRGEGPWYIMLWEILPNARGPLIVDFCLRIGYTTILLGTLGFFGLGLPPESPDWGSTINEGRKLLSIYLHPALPPAFALLSLVLGLNLLADGLREESLKD